MGVLGQVAPALAQLGRPAPGPEALRDWIGPPLQRSFRERLGLEPDEVERALALYRQHFVRRGLRESSLYPGVDALLARRVSATWRQALYVAVFARLLLPADFASPFGVAPGAEPAPVAAVEAMPAATVDRTVVASSTTAPVVAAPALALTPAAGVTATWLLGSLGLGLGLVLGAVLGGLVHLLRRGAASRALIVSTVNVFGGAVILAAAGLPWLTHGRPGGSPELIAFGACLTIFGVLVAIADRLGLLPKKRQP